MIYVLDLDAVRAALAEPRPSTGSGPMKSIKSLALRKGATAAKKKSGRKSSR